MIPAMGSRSCVVAMVLLASGPAAALPPDAPRLTTASRTFVAFAGEAAPVKVTWSPVAGAARYRARWTSGAQTYDRELTDTVFERPEMTPGEHVLTVTAIDAAGIESAPSDLRIDVVRVEATAPGAKTTSGRPASGAFAVGAKFSSPGLSCQLGPGTSGMDVVAKVAGAYPLRCGGEAGQPAVEVPVIIAPVIVSGDLAPIARDTETKLHLTIASVGAIGDQLEIAAIGDLDLGAALRVPGGLDIPVTPSETATSAGLIVRANGVELGRVAIDLVDKPAPYQPPVPEPDWFALDLGAQIGAFLPPDVGGAANDIGHPLDPDDTLTGGPYAGLRLGLFPTRRVGFELESGVVTSSYTGRLGVVPLMINRGSIVGRLVEDGRFGLRGLLGGDILTTLGDGGTNKVGSVGGLHYGAAFTIETRPGVSVRLEALHVITVAQDAGYAHCLELQIGVVARLGRRDRWK